MPRYKARIYIREIDREVGFNAENDEEAKKELQSFLQSAISDRTECCKVKRDT